MYPKHDFSVQKVSNCVGWSPPNGAPVDTTPVNRLHKKDRTVSESGVMLVGRGASRSVYRSLWLCTYTLRKPTRIERCLAVSTQRVLPKHDQWVRYFNNGSHWLARRKTYSSSPLAWKKTDSSEMDGRSWNKKSTVWAISIIQIPVRDSQNILKWSCSPPDLGAERDRERPRSVTTV